ncbi:DnaB-like helicase N-terminal domain-containing protein [Roseofilum sp. BLCC_M91]|uniref:DnaB-like helicase N-terminal domain-containing protein n=1 Tax=Roseofilum halophilum BLCC-M91 TaxID=3022259 RepID=A0ABT7BJK9_9CYAN|nr:DnaB-like helicase N-terminal domain-containing protein [Roseofilum halophilum]MDJ1179326.1 DnaB-like helicase N-terminal domain-containing protein [Roseofilum halophilum BLCC-M91]
MVAEFALHRRLNSNHIFDQPPPQNIEVEENLLGGLLLDPCAWDRIEEFDLTPDVFSSPSNQILFTELAQMNKAGLKVDLISATNHLAEQGLLNKVGGQVKLVQLLEKTVSAVNIDEYAKLLLNKYQRRKIIECSQELAALAQNPLSTLEDMEAKRSALSSYVLMKGVRRGVDLSILDKEMETLGDEDSIERDLRLKNMAKRWGFSGLREMKDIHARWILSKILKPKSFSLASYEKHCQGLKTDWILPGWIPRQAEICLYGSGGVGKTRLVHSMIYSLISGESWGDYEVGGAKRVLVVQSDQGDRENNQLLDIQGFYSLSHEQRERYRLIQDWTTGRLSYLKKEILEHRPDVVFIDSLTTVNVDTITDENSMRYATPLIHWKRLAQECDCAFVVLHHANKGGGMRGTTAIHNTVDEVWQLSHRTERPNGEVVLSIEKSRNRGPSQYLLKYDSDSWRWNVEGEMEGEEILSISDLGKNIRAWLNQTGKKHEVEEISEAIGASINTIRKELGGLLKAGLISAERGNSRRKVYFTHLADPTDPTDPTDPELIRTAGSVDEVRTQPLSVTELENDDTTPKKFKDPIDPQKPSVSDETKNSKNCGSIGSVRPNEAETQSYQASGTDPGLRISSGSVPDQLDQLAENTRWKPAKDSDLSPGARVKVVGANKSKWSGKTAHIRWIEKPTKTVPWGIRYELDIDGFPRFEAKELMVQFDEGQIDEGQKQLSIFPPMPRKGDRVYVPLDGYWELVEVQRVHKKVFSAQRIEKFDKETLTAPVANGLKEWRSQPDPIRIGKGAGITDEQGRVQEWQIDLINSTHYMCRCAGGEGRAIGKREVSRTDLKFPDWVYEPVESLGEGG